MPRTPRASETNAEEATSPGVGNDASQGYDVGSRWINTATKVVFFCVDNSLGAAVWKDVSTPGAGSHPVSVHAVAPIATDDSSSGFAVGDHWIDSVKQRIYQALDVSAGAATWDRVDERKHNTAALDPGVGDDSTQGYEPTSIWVNTITTTSFICASASVGAAVWNEIVGQANRDTPGVTFLGQSLFHYGGSGGFPSGNIQYGRLWLTAGQTFDRMRFFLDSGGSANRHIRLGFYSQSDPLDESLPPLTRVAQTAESGTDYADGSFVTVPLLAPYTIPVTGYYWLAGVTDSVSPKFAVTPASYRAGFLTVRRESTSGTILPAITGTLSNPLSSVGFLSAVEDWV